MPVTTLTVGAAVAPTVIETYISHYLNRKPLHQKPTAHISYHEGLELIRRFLHYASFHTVDELQAFTSQWVPVPTWVHTKEVEIPGGQLARSAEYLQAELGPEGIEQIGGKTWWQWRRDNKPLKAEWIEMKKDQEARKKSTAPKGQRIMLYVHGGAYFFGSVDEHRYQMQRHARKLKARIIAPKYRLAPQFPFPCGLQDCLAVYLYLLEQGHDRTTIVLAGDSAGGGMVLSMLVTMRDQNIPLPAGAVLISPWVDLTHSFPSLNGDGKLDYIPKHGFLHRPSMSWPPPNADDLRNLDNSPQDPTKKEKGSSQVSLPRSSKEDKAAQKEAHNDRVRGFSLQDAPSPDVNGLLNPSIPVEEVYNSPDGSYSIGPNGLLAVQLEGERVEIKDQIQMYAANHLLMHPLVSPALQPSLGGLPPLLIQTGGGELLHDEQVYVAHKAAAPMGYLPPPSKHQTAARIQQEAARYRPTPVQLQVWDDLCHVAPTLSFTRPAKHMYRSIAQFGAWALARAQKTTIDILDDDSISFVSTGSLSSSSTQVEDPSPEDIKLSMPQSVQHVGFESISKKDTSPVPKVGRAGDALPPFEKHMIRQRVDRHGRIHPLPDPKEMEALNLPVVAIGVPKSGPVNKWMKAQQQWNGKFAKQKLKVQKQRMKDMQKGYEGFDGETPAPTALAGRRIKGMKPQKKNKRSWGMSMWSIWGSKHDEATIEREEKADEAENTEPATTAVEPTDANGNTDGPPSPPPIPPKSRKRSVRRPRPSLAAPTASRSRSRSHHSSVTDQNQAPFERLENLAPAPGIAAATALAPERRASPLPSPTIEVTDYSRPQSPETLVPATDGSSTRPFRGGVAYPFSLRVEGEGRDVNASTITLNSVAEGVEDVETEEIEQKVDGSAERPSVERFVTAGVGDVKFSSSRTGDGEERVERPGVERFETAQEVLSASGK
ncbi:alpha/beta-hydrolase [Polyplosphaeria fusca]|uniref:Alpha/beta-hydrolase n=1 Tax=Polyplosphaeria fusca TaxID=682080 RepID=A0A9P4QMV2_9PLEO|nr:alpha/beta-hydrolase [Polyplosphaeria fusca]